MKNNKGITLIALVITIIVMLILVTVTIRVATTGNLFAHAGNAARETKKAAEEENALADGNVGDKSIDEIVAEATGETTAPTLIHFTIDETEYTAEEEMSWAAWIASPRYNTDGFKAGEENVSDSPDDPMYQVLTSDGLKQVGGYTMNPRTHQMIVFYCTTKGIISDGTSYTLMDL